MWFASGVVMMYAQMPILTEGERLRALPPLPVDRIHVSPVEAVKHVAFAAPPRSVTITSLFGRPAYRIAGDGARLFTVFADDGRAVSSFTFEEAVQSIAAYVPDRQTRWRLSDILNRPDQWTLAVEMDALRPLYRVVVDDGLGTVLYVSAVTGDVVLRTTSRSRALAWAGAIPHWLYLTAIRQYPEVWRRFVMSVSAAGCVLCLLGLTLGVWRYSPSKKYRVGGRGPSRSPYDGVMQWHFWCGLTFGAVTFTWILSGMFSLNPGRFSGDSTPTIAQAESFAGGPLRLEQFHASPSGTRDGRGSSFTIKEVALAQVDGRPFYRLSAQNGTMEFVDGDGAIAPPFSRAFLLEAARRAVKGATIADVQALDDYDAYYYDRDWRKPLPVLRVKFDDTHRTWLYIDPARGAVLSSLDRATRFNRWIFQGLHTFDVPFLWRSRPLWDLVTMGLCAGGFLLSITAIVNAFRRVRGVTKRPAGSPAS